MSTSTPSEDGTEVVKWYTRARRFPQMIGKTSDGAKIWGGPYTYTQVIAGGILLWAMNLTSGLWAHFGTVVNVIVAFGVTWGVVLALGRLPIGSRSPLSVGSGALRALRSSPTGTLGGSAVRIRPPHRVAVKVAIYGPRRVSETDPAPSPIPASSSARPGNVPGRLSWSRAASAQVGGVARAAWQLPRLVVSRVGAIRDRSADRGEAAVSVAAPERVPTTPISTSTPAPELATSQRVAPALSGVQRLLAAAAPSQQED